ncbi:roadblock/LC7 domain-containing protein [Kitasatospora sp. GAS204B]|uniref:roadblock/LC7 domain-containing protein n=1 Tax=unclassified Kitasatospora TaxID=2633591 RepID=UPI0024757949|nr:roadblock/LC7 domain-containing protein [Kitasatospora sp. GAS204B]MDH6118371.1 putative regulator of Ras-like GTPase activity (Roadblock/LC7/MglB family) [Kitasatospora sp. GAS204B]
MSEYDYRNIPAAAATANNAGQPVSQGALNVRWLLGDFLGLVAGVEEAVVVSSDGLLLADSQQGQRSDQLSAIVSALTSLAQGLARAIDFGGVKQTMVTMDEGHLVVMAISDGSCLGVYAALSCDLGVLAYQMSLLVERAGHALTPQVRSELHRAMAVR